MLRRQFPVFLVPQSLLIIIPQNIFRSLFYLSHGNGIFSAQLASLFHVTSPRCAASLRSQTRSKPVPSDVIMFLTFPRNVPRNPSGVTGREGARRRRKGKEAMEEGREGEYAQEGLTEHRLKKNHVIMSSSRL